MLPSEETSGKYDAVLIIGPDTPAQYIREIRYRIKSAEKSLCVVGDGKRGVSKAAIARSIEGRVDDDTLFILDGHGNTMLGRHWISLFSGPLPVRSTLSVIDALLKITTREGVSSPTVCVFSCFAGKLASHIQRRTRGFDAMIIAHGPANYTTLSNFTSSNIIKYVVSGGVTFLDAKRKVIEEKLVEEQDPITIIYPNELSPVVYNPIKNVVARKENGERMNRGHFGGISVYSLENMAYLCALRGKRKDLQEILEIDGVDHTIVLFKVLAHNSSSPSRKPLNTLLAAGVNLNEGRNAENKRGKRPSALRKAVIDNNRSAVKALLKAGFDPTELDMHILEGHIESKTKTLIEKAQRQWKKEHPQSTLSEVDVDTGVCSLVRAC